MRVTRKPKGLRLHNPRCMRNTRVRSNEESNMKLRVSRIPAVNAGVQLVAVWPADESDRQTVKDNGINGIQFNSSYPFRVGDLLSIEDTVIKRARKSERLVDEAVYVTAHLAFKGDDKITIVERAPAPVTAAQVIGPAAEA